MDRDSYIQGQADTQSTKRTVRHIGSTESTDRHTDKNSLMQAYVEADIKADINRPDRQTEGERHADIDTEAEVGDVKTRETYTQKQADKERLRQTNRHRKRHIR